MAKGLGNPMGTKAILHRLDIKAQQEAKEREARKAAKRAETEKLEQALREEERRGPTVDFAKPELVIPLEAVEQKKQKGNSDEAKSAEKDKRKSKDKDKKKQEKIEKEADGSSDDEPPTPPRTLDSIEGRLKQHARAFDGLLSLIPANLYYQKDNSDQWKRKKSTPEEARAARLAKFDPKNLKSVKDVQDEKSKAISDEKQAGEKRKREDGDDGEVERRQDGELLDDNAISDTEGITREIPLQGLKRPKVIKVPLPPKRGNHNPKYDPKPKPAHLITPRDPNAPPLTRREEKDERKRVRRLAAKERKDQKRQMREVRVDEALELLNKNPEAEISRQTKALIEAREKKVAMRAERDKKEAEKEKIRAEKAEAQKKRYEEWMQKKGKKGEQAESGKVEGLADPEPKQAIADEDVSMNGENSKASASPSVPPSPTFDGIQATSSSSISSVATTAFEDKAVAAKPNQTAESFDKSMNASTEPIATTSSSQTFVTAQDTASSQQTAVEAQTSTTEHLDDNQTSRSGESPPGSPEKPKRTPEELRRKLAETIAQMRAARKADGHSGQEPRTRQELLEQRERKAAAARERKMELKRQAREAELAKLTDGDVHDDDDAEDEDNTDQNRKEQSDTLHFGTIAFTNGQCLSTSNPTTLTAAAKSKHRLDANQALQALEAKRQRLSAYDPAKRSEIQGKDLWLNAKKRAQGERIHDDLSLARKSVKRAEKAKEKSGREWEERKEGVRKGIEMRQRKREENLRKRREERVRQTGGLKKAAKSGGNKKRAGFEGSFSGRSGKK